MAQVFDLEKKEDMMPRKETGEQQRVEGLERGLQRLYSKEGFGGYRVDKVL